MNSELKKLQQLAPCFDPKNGQKNNRGENLSSCSAQVVQECDRITEAMTQAVFTQESENVLERYIQYHQAGIIALADQLQPYLVAAGEPAQKLAIGSFISRLFELLNYIERFFSKYFDTEASIPEAYRLMALKQLDEPLTELTGQLETHITSAALKQCVFHYLASFREETFPGGVRFRNLIYLKACLTELQLLFRQKNVLQWDEQLTTSLIYLNFNHLAFFCCCQDSVRAELEHTGNKEQYLVGLSRALTQFKSMQSKPGLSFAPAWPNIKSMLEAWLNDEIAAAILQTPKDAGYGRSAGETGEDKLLLNQSVAQIGCLTRLLYEEGYYATTNITDIFKFTVRHYRSKRQQHISTGSLSKEYYSVNQVTAAIVRDLLQRMQARLMKNYFP